MKRTFARFFLTVILAVCLIPSALASVIAPLASDYFDGAVEVTVTATGVQGYDKTITFSGLTAGEKYRVVVTFYAEDSSVSDSILKTSDTVTAK